MGQMERGVEESAPMWREGTFHSTCKLKLGKKNKSMSFYLIFLPFIFCLITRLKTYMPKKTDITVENKEILREEVVEVAWLKQEHVLDEQEMSKSKN